MAKPRKVQRVREPQKTVVETTPGTQSADSASKVKRLSTTEQFQQEYAYVLKDLRLIFVLAGVMFALLIIINLVLR
jgi:hypothetical protein